jgi:hypothetical protein
MRKLLLTIFLLTIPCLLAGGDVFINSYMFAAVEPPPCSGGVAMGGLGVSGSPLAGWDNNYTIADFTHTLSAGNINKIQVYIGTIGGNNRLKFKVLRQVDDNVNFISETSYFTASSTGVLTCDLGTPLTVQEGDILAVYSDGARVSQRNLGAGSGVVYGAVSGDVTTTRPRADYTCTFPPCQNLCSMVGAWWCP